MVRKKRQNPTNYDYVDILVDLINKGSADELVRAIIYYKQGENCKDCDKKYWSCECEWCNECSYQRCLCDLELEGKNKNQKLAIIKKVAWELACLTIDDELWRYFLDRNSISEFRVFELPRLKNVKIPKIDQKWLKSR